MAITPLPTPPSRNDPTNFSTRADAFLGALPAFGTEANALAVDVNADAVTASDAATTATTQAGIATTQAGIATTQAGIATTKAGEASASALAADASAQAAAALAASFAGTSTTSVSIGIGEKTFTTQSGEQYTSGIWVTIVSQANAANYMFGQVVSYSGSTLVVNVQSTGGSGTHADWNISLAGVRGAPGTGITDQAVGWTASGGTVSKTLTVDESKTTSQLQDILVSGTNIKTINGGSVLGSGDLVVGGGGEFDFVADGAITAGKAVILKSNGKVAQSVIAAASVGSAVNLSGNNSTAVSTCYDPVNDKFVVFYLDTTDGNKGKAVVGTVSSGTVTFGTPVTFYNAALFNGSNNNIDSCYDEDTGQIIVAYADNTNLYVELRAWTVSGTTLNFVSSLATGQPGYSLGVCYDTSVNRILIAHRNNSWQYATVVQNTGTTLVQGATDIAASSPNGYTSSVVHCQGHVTAGLNVMNYNTGGRGYVVIVKIDPSTFALSFAGAIASPTYDGYAWGTKTLAWSSAYQRLLSLISAGPSFSYGLKVEMWSVSASALTVITNSTPDASTLYSNPYQNFPSIACSPDGLSACVAFPDAGEGYYGKMVFTGALSASGVNWGTQLQYQTNDVGWTSIAYNASGQALVGYSVTSGLGRAAVGAAPIPDSRTSFIGFAQNTVTNGQTVTVTTPFGVNENQSGLTPNTNYFLSSSDGSTLTTTVNGPRVGKALSATELLVLGSNVYQV